MEEQKSCQNTISNDTTIVNDVLKNCWGWEDVNAAACDVFNSIHRNLLEGQFVFGYKNTIYSESSPLMQVIIVRYNKDIFGVGVVTTGYTMLLPNVPLTYLEKELAEDLKKWKLESYILNTYKSIINSIRNEVTCN